MRVLSIASAADASAADASVATASAADCECSPVRVPLDAMRICFFTYVNPHMQVLMFVYFNLARVSQQDVVFFLLHLQAWE